MDVAVSAAAEIGRVPLRTERPPPYRRPSPAMRDAEFHARQSVLPALLDCGRQALNLLICFPAQNVVIGIFDAACDQRPLILPLITLAPPNSGLPAQFRIV